MIINIDNFSKKSFKNFSNDEDCVFKEKNIIFGYNGRGKSTLALGIAMEFLKTNKLNELRFFNRDYIKSELLLSEDMNTKLKGVRTVFGKKDISINNKISDLEGEITDVDELEKELDLENKHIKDKIAKIHEATKGRNRINKKNSSLSCEEVIKQYENDLDEAKKIDFKAELDKFNVDLEFLQDEHEKIINVPIPSMHHRKLNSNEKNDLKNIMQFKYEAHDIPSDEVIEWIQSGIELHKSNENICKFCHNRLDLSLIKDNLKIINANKIQTKIIRLKEIKKALLSLNNDFSELHLYKQSFRILGMPENEISDIFDFKMKEKGFLENIIKNIEYKINNMSSSIDIDTDKISELENSIENTNGLLTELRNNRKKDIETHIENFNILVKGKIARAVLVSDVKSDLEKLKAMEDNVKNTKYENDKIKFEILELKNSISEYEEFRNYINNTFEFLNIKFKLILGDDKKTYYLSYNEHIKEHLSIDDISEGEKNLLALLYFYFELYKDSAQNVIKDEIELVIIDDPISSLDDQNKFYVLEILRDILDIHCQVFIFTHSWDDFCNLTYRNSDAKLFEVYKDKYSHLKTIKNNVEPYKKLFQDINNLSEERIENISESDVYNAANSMRRVMEEFLKFKTPNKTLPQKSNQAAIEDLFYISTNKHLGKQRKLKLGAFLTFINVLSHKPCKSDEILNNAKFLMNFIKDMDKAHFNAMTH